MFCPSCGTNAEEVKLTDSWTEYEGLENGGEVTLHLDFDDSGKDIYVRTYGKLPSAFEKKLIVTELTELTAFDPFEGVNLVFEGEDGSGTLTIIDTENVKDVCRDFSYTADRTEGLKNGDAVTVSFTAPEERLTALARDYGKVPSAPEKIYTVSGLPGYYKALSDIPADELERYTGEVVNEFKTDYTSDKLTEKGYYLQDLVCVGHTLTVRDAEDAEYDNLLYTYLRMTIKTDIEGEQVIYIPLYMRNASYDKEGHSNLIFKNENTWHPPKGVVIVHGRDNTYIRVRGTKDFSQLPLVLQPDVNTDNKGMKEAGSTLESG